MRRKDRMIIKTETLSILENGEYGILSTASPDNEPYGVPFSYCLVNEGIYIHCALEGRAIDNINRNPIVSFCVVGKTRVLPDKFSTKYESCIVQGRIAETFGEEKQAALEGFLHKYSQDFISEGLKLIEKFQDKTRVFRISMESLSGKANR